MFVYANFVQSLDGRIAVNDRLPEGLGSSTDFRLFLELQAQADCLITHGGYLRAIGERRLDDVLQVGLASHRDLADWRREQGLSEQPAVVVASGSLDFPLPESLAAHKQRVYIATGDGADAGRVLAWESKGYEVIRAGKGTHVEAAPLVAAISRLGFRSAYLLAGPLMLAAMLRDQMLSRLYLTISHVVLGGECFDTIFRGEQLKGPAKFELRSLYYSSEKHQWFAQFDCVDSSSLERT